MGIPVVSYEPYMGWYDSKKANKLKCKISEIDTFEEQLKKICIRFSSRYQSSSSTWNSISTDYEYLFQDESVRCNHISTLYECCERGSDSILEFVFAQDGVIIGVNYMGTYLLIGYHNRYIQERIINDFFGIELGDDVFELVDSETQRKKCHNCRQYCSRSCNPWYKNTYLNDFGHTPDSKKPLSWKLVEFTGKNYNIARLIASKCIAVVPFSCTSSPQELYKQAFYENSYIRKWLSEVFIREFFNEQEKEKIISVSIPNIHQMEKWLPEEIDKICKPTKFSIDNGASVFNNHMNSVSCAYWLADTGRKPGYSSTVVLSNGKIYKSAYMSAPNVCVRPVIDIIRKEQWK